MLEHSMDAVLPGQVEASGFGERIGAIGLLWAVFIDGIRTYCTGLVARAVDPLAYREAEYWIFCSEADVATSFSNLCDLFEIDARRLRRRLLEFRDHPTPEVHEFLRRIGAVAAAPSGRPAAVAAARGVLD